MRVKISEIRMRNRIRQNPGDISSLKDSMSRVGLLQPILIDPDNYLVAGYRRLTAAKSLQWDSIDVRLVDVQDREEGLLIEAEENNTRLDFTQEEHERAEKLMSRYGRKSILWRFWNLILDFFDRLFKR